MVKRIRDILPNEAGANPDDEMPTAHMDVVLPDTDTKLRAEGWRLHVYCEHADGNVFVASERVLPEKVADARANRVFDSRRILLHPDEVAWLHARLGELLKPPQEAPHARVRHESVGDRRGRRGEAVTKKQRAQVVELLRCAADLCAVPRPDSTSPYYEALAAVGSGTHYEPSSHYLEWSARCELMREMKGSILKDFTPDEYADALLEAAARVEEGSWPSR